MVPSREGVVMGSQAELELTVRDRLVEASVAAIDWEMISDAVDVFLCAEEVQLGRAIDRDDLPVWAEMRVLIQATGHVLWMLGARE